MPYPKAITALLMLLGLAFFLESQAQTCPFTYEQGVNVGCQIAQAANDDGCYSARCSNAYQNTIRDYESSCPDYILGVIEGFAACNTLPPWQSNVTNDPTDTGNNIIDPPCENAVYINGRWECQ